MPRRTKRLRLVLPVVSSVALVRIAMAGTFYGVENWRGARAWEEAKRELAAAGETIDLGSLIPPPVPDERNVAMIPLFAPALDYRVDPVTGRLAFGVERLRDTASRAMPYGKMNARPSGRLGGWTSGRALPLDRVRDYYARQKDFPPFDSTDSAAGAVLHALTWYKPELQELDDALGVQPEGRFPVKWWHEQPARIACATLRLDSEVDGRPCACARSPVSQRDGTRRRLMTWRRSFVCGQRSGPSRRSSVT